MPPLPELLPLLLEGLDLPADFSRCLHIALRCPVWPQLLHFASRNRHLAFSCPALPQQALVDITGTNVHWRGLTTRVHRRPQVLIHTCRHVLSRFVEHADVSVVSRDRSLAFSRPAIVSVSRASSPNEVMFTCLISFGHLSHLSSRLSEDVYWN